MEVGVNFRIVSKVNENLATVDPAANADAQFAVLDQLQSGRNGWEQLLLYA